MTEPDIILPRLAGSASAAKQLVADMRLTGRRRVHVSARAANVISSGFVFAFIEALAEAGVKEVTVSGATAEIVATFQGAAVGLMTVTAANRARSYEALLKALRDAVYDSFGEERSDFEIADKVRLLLARTEATD